MTASRNGHPQAADRLLVGGADVDLKDNVNQLFCMCIISSLYSIVCIQAPHDLYPLYRMAGQLSWPLAKMAISRLWRDCWKNMQTLTCQMIL